MPAAPRKKIPLRMWRHPQGYVGFRPHCDEQIITRISAFFKRGWLFLSGERRPGYWAVLPATVRYDKTLRPNAKLLYAEITALADANGLGELLLFAGCALVLASFLALRRETALDTPQAETGNP